MRDRGFRWQQNTLSAVESGERPLRFAEAGDLADVLSVPGGLEGLLRDDHQSRLRSAVLEGVTARKALEASLQTYLTQQLTVAAIADEAEAAGEQIEGETRTLTLLTLHETPGEVALGWEIGMLRGDDDGDDGTVDWLFDPADVNGGWTQRLRSSYERLGHLRG